MGYFHQEIANLQPPLSVVQNVAQTSIATATLNQTVLAAFGLSREFFEQSTSSLSSGQQVKVSLVKILMSDVNLLLLDEPSNFLDLMAVQALKTFLQERDLTVILVSHDQRLIEQVTTIKWEIENNRLEVSNRYSFSGNLR